MAPQHPQAGSSAGNPIDLDSESEEAETTSPSTTVAPQVIDLTQGPDIEWMSAGEMPDEEDPYCVISLLQAPGRTIGERLKQAGASTKKQWSHGAAESRRFAVRFESKASGSASLPDSLKRLNTTMTRFHGTDPALFAHHTLAYYGRGDLRRNAALLWQTAKDAITLLNEQTGEDVKGPCIPVYNKEGELVLVRADEERSVQQA